MDKEDVYIVRKKEKGYPSIITVHDEDKSKCRSGLYQCRNLDEKYFCPHFYGFYGYGSTDKIVDDIGILCSGKIRK